MTAEKEALQKIKRLLEISRAIHTLEYECPNILVHSPARNSIASEIISEALRLASIYDVELSQRED
jgi:hypothetical protein